MSLAHFGVCVLAQNLFNYSTRSYFFFFFRGGDAAAVLSVHPTCTSISVCAPLFISSRLCCLSSDTDLLLFLYGPYPHALLTHDA